MIKSINSIEDVKLFAFQLVNEENLSFHPDDDFSDYINLKTEELMYSVEEVNQLNRLMNKCFILCEQAEIDIYEIMGDPLYRSMKVGIYSEN